MEFKVFSCPLISKEFFEFTRHLKYFVNSRLWHSFWCLSTFFEYICTSKVRFLRKFFPSQLVDNKRLFEATDDTRNVGPNLNPACVCEK